MKSADAEAYLKVKEKDHKLECISLAVGIAVSSGDKKRITADKVIADAKKISAWIGE